MRIAYFTDTYHPQVNGLVTSIDSNREELARLGHDVLVFGPVLPGAKDDPKVFRLRGLTYPPQPEYTFVLPWGKGHPLRKFERHKVDLIHCHGVWGAWLVAWLISRFKKLPVVLTYHTFFELYLHYFPLPNGFLRWINAFFTRHICNACDLVIAPTQIIKDALVGYGAKTRIEVLPTGLTADVFEKKGITKSQYGVAEDTLLLSSAGRLGPEKNFGLLFDALAQAKPRVPKFHLVIAGDGPERNHYEAHIARLGLKDHVTFLGYVTRGRVLDLAEASDLFVFPSVTETQGMVILEAMGRGTPVIAANALGPSQILASGRGGWLAKPNDVEDFAEKVAHALNDNADYEAKKSQAVGLAQEYSAATINAKLGVLYKQVIKG